MEELQKITEERKEKDKEVTENNRMAYTKPKKIEEEVIKIKVGNHTKEKVIERKTYHNGVVKSRITGIIKDGKLLYGARPKGKAK